MSVRFSFRFPALFAMATLAATALFAQSTLRPPATPLVTHNPYFSIWSDTDTLTDADTVHWTGHNNALTSILRIDGKLYRVMGRGPGAPLQQTARKVTALHTQYTFTGAGVNVDLSFFTPAFLTDLDLLSRPVTYLTWTVSSSDGSPHKVEVLLDASPDLATSYPGQAVTVSRSRTQQMDVVSVGSREQNVLNRSGDDLRIDWGYFRIAVPRDEGATLAMGTRLLRGYATGDSLPQEDDLSVPAGGEAGVKHIAVALDLGSVAQAPVSRHVLLTYNEDYAFQLMHQNLRPYWQRNGMTAGQMLDGAAADYPQLEQKGATFDAEFQRNMTAVGGEQYAWLCTLAYRQAIAAHTLVAGPDGEPLTFEKENFSNGDTATVDVIYPGAPIWLLFNPKLLHAEILPVMRYASSSHWHFPFAPHDLGQFPLANGQTYGGGEKTEENQMPVEETGNLLLLVDALARAENDTTLAAQFWPKLTQWAEYLRTHGLDPENQLTTDDFAGHVAHNSNLSIKAIEGVAAYANLAKLLHKEEEAKHYHAEARRMAAEWIKLAKEGDHYKLAYNSPGTWSQKYNLVWDKLLHYDLFPASVAKDELAFYKGKLNRYGLPLDSRRDYTKLDWELWTATLADDDATFHSIMDPVYTWINEGPTRVPMTDWYDTKTGAQEHFQARSVVGGVFIKALSNAEVLQKYRSK